MIDDGSLERATKTGGENRKENGVMEMLRVMNYDGATGYCRKSIWYEGDVHNDERSQVWVGCKAPHKQLAYQKALAYAKDRLQGRDATVVESDGLGDPIIVHPDVRRNLMDQKCFSEGSDIHPLG